MVIEEEETSQQMRVNEVADTKAQVQYDDTQREGVKQVTFLSYEETTAKERSMARGRRTPLRRRMNVSEHVLCMKHHVMKVQP